MPIGEPVHPYVRRPVTENTDIPVTIILSVFIPMVDDFPRTKQTTKQSLRNQNMLPDPPFPVGTRMWRLDQPIAGTRQEGAALPKSARFPDLTARD